MKTFIICCFLAVAVAAGADRVRRNMYGAPQAPAYRPPAPAPVYNPPPPYIPQPQPPSGYVVQPPVPVILSAPKPTTTTFLIHNAEAPAPRTTARPYVPQAPAPVYSAPAPVPSYAAPAPSYPAMSHGGY